jgi:hypothetical protein
MIYDEEALRDKIHGFISRKEVQYPDLGSQQIQKGITEIIKRAHLPYTHYPHTATSS